MKKNADISKDKGDLASAKKAAVMEGQKNARRFSRMIISLALGLAVALAAVWLIRGLSGQPSAAPTAAPADGALVTLAASQFADGKARHYSYEAPGGITIRYFIIKSSDGVIRAAFDACDVCWPSNRGYRQDGDFMVCNNCGRRFPSVKVNEVRGGCNPAPLERQLQGEKVLLKVADILKGQIYFNFSRG